MEQTERVALSSILLKEGKLVEEDFLRATGIKLAMLSLDGELLGFSGEDQGICALIKGTKEGHARCTECYQQVLAKQNGRRKPAIATCHAGLSFFHAPVRLSGPPVAVLLGRHVLTDSKQLRSVVSNATALGLSQKKVMSAVRAIPVWRKEQLLAVANLLLNQVEALIHKDMQQEALNRRLKEITNLYQASKSFSPTMDFEALMETVLDWALKITPADGGSIMLVDPVTQELTMHAARGVSAGGRQSRIKVGTGIAGWVAKEGKPLLLHGGVKDRRFRSLAPRAVIRSAMSVPLVAEGRVVGVLNVNNTSSRPLFDEDDLKVMKLFAERASIAIENARLYDVSNSRIEELTNLNELGKDLSSTLEIEEIIGLVFDMLTRSIDFSATGILVTDFEPKLYCALREKFSGTELLRLERAAVKSLTRFSAPKVRDVDVDIIRGRPHFKAEDASRRDVNSILCLPLKLQKKCLGLIFVASFDVEAFTVDNLRTLSTLSSQVAVSLENARLYQNLRNNYTKTIAALSATIDAKDHYTRGHSDRVMEFALEIGQELDLDEDELQTLHFAGLLHDIGKIGVAEEILLKPGALSDEEFAAVRLHSNIGAGIIEQIDFLHHVIPTILHHHERYEGGGYPDGLQGREIPFLARILSVADSFEAMTSKRAYRDALNTAQAIAELRRCAGSQFDPVVVDAFMAVLERHFGKGLVETSVADIEMEAHPSPKQMS